MVLSPMTLWWSMRWLLPVVVIVGVVPQLYSLWFVWRVVSILLPNWLYQKGDDCVLAVFQRVIIFFFEHWVEAELLFYGDVEEVFKRKERVLYLTNHQSTVDWIVAGMLALRQGSEGHLRFVMKRELQYVPFIGMYLYNHGCIYVRRGNFNADKMLKELDYLSNKAIPSWIVIFPEGTRYNPESKDLIRRNKEFAKSQGLEPLAHCSMPKSRGAYLTLNKMRNNLDIVYNVTVMYEDTVQKDGRRTRAPSMFAFLKLVKPRIHVYIQRIPISNLPSDEAELKTWLYQTFSHSDRILSKFYKTNPADDHPVMTLGESTAKRLSLKKTLPYLIAMTAASVFPWVNPWMFNWYWKFCLIHSIGGCIFLSLKSWF